MKYGRKIKNLNTNPESFHFQFMQKRAHSKSTITPPPPPHSLSTSQNMTRLAREGRVLRRAEERNRRQFFKKANSLNLPAFRQTRPMLYLNRNILVRSNDHKFFDLAIK